MYMLNLVSRVQFFALCLSHSFQLFYFRGQLLGQLLQSATLYPLRAKLLFQKTFFFGQCRHFGLQDLVFCPKSGGHFRHYTHHNFRTNRTTCHYFVREWRVGRLIGGIIGGSGSEFKVRTVLACLSRRQMGRF